MQSWPSILQSFQSFFHIVDNMSPSVVDIVADTIKVLANSARFSNSMTWYRASHSSANVASNNVEISCMIELSIILLTVLQFYYLLINLLVTYRFGTKYKLLPHTSSLCGANAIKSPWFSVPMARSIFPSAKHTRTITSGIAGYSTCQITAPSLMSFFFF